MRKIPRKLLQNKFLDFLLFNIKGYHKQLQQISWEMLLKELLLINFKSTACECDKN